MPSVIERWNHLKNVIESIPACENGCREPARLIAVSKGQPPEAILPLLAAGQRDFGENRVQEAKAKWADLRNAYPDVRLHLIGSLQSNKARAALALFDTIQTLDSVSLAETLARHAFAPESRTRQFFLQVNTGAEPQKGGVALEKLAALHARCGALGLPVSGLMCVPPADEPATPHFTLLAEQARALGLPYLSMGMSEDYETALACGATHIRVGTKLFGPRPATTSSAPVSY